jgi:hypothetical protein
MNTTRQALVQVAAAIATGWLLMPAAHANTPAEGVKCPSGSNAQISSDNKKLVCATEERVERASVCSPLVFKNIVDINLNQRIEMIEAGSDTCAVSTGATAPRKPCCCRATWLRSSSVKCAPVLTSSCAPRPASSSQKAARSTSAMRPRA